MSRYFPHKVFDRTFWALVAGWICVRLLWMFKKPIARFLVVSDWVLGCAVALMFFGSLGYMLIRFLRSKRKQKMAVALEVFEKALAEQIRQRALADPQFRTPCYQCHHFNSDLRGCQLQLIDRKSRIRLKEFAQEWFCVYWNCDLPPKLRKALTL